MSCSKFLCLPNELFSLLVTDWIGWKEVARMDSAMCNRASRQDWLDILKNDCIFHSVSLGYYRSPPNNYRWCILRQIRTKEIDYDSSKLCEDEQTVRWLQHTAPFIATIKVLSTNPTPITSLVRVCNKLKVLSVASCVVDDTFWDLVRNNPSLEALHVYESKSQYEPTQGVPANVSLSHLKKLEVLYNSFPNIYVVAFIKQLPALQSLKLAKENVCDVYRALPLACARLVQLDLSFAVHSLEDNLPFYTLMKSLNSGLRCLVLPAIESFTSRELLAISEYHSHSLRCLSLSSGLHGAANCLADLINSLPHLHTLQMLYESLLSLVPKKIHNPAILHLMVDFSRWTTDILPCVADQFPSATKLSLSCFRGDSIVVHVANLLKLRPLIQTVSVDSPEIMEQLIMALPGTKVMKYSKVDIFAHEY